MNWITITADDLKAAVNGQIIDAATTAHTGFNDPVVDCIADAVSAVRGAISTGNVLDADPTKVPRSLRGLTARMAAYALMGRIPMPLDDDQRATRQGDQSRLNRIADQKQRFELADTPAGSAEMQQGSTIETLERGNHGNDRHTLRGL